VTFDAAKVTKTASRGHDGRANIRLARLPCASRRARAGANSHLLVLKQSRLSRAPACDARRHATAPEARSSRPSMACAGMAETSRTKNARKDPARETHTVNFFFGKYKTCATEKLR
jgi:hypothetical protein